MIRGRLPTLYAVCQNGMDAQSNTASSMLTALSFNTYLDPLL